MNFTRWSSSDLNMIKKALAMNPAINQASNHTQNQIGLPISLSQMHVHFLCNFPTIVSHYRHQANFIFLTCEVEWLYRRIAFVHRNYYEPLHVNRNDFVSSKSYVTSLKLKHLSYIYRAPQTFLIYLQSPCLTWNHHAASYRMLMICC